MSVGPMVTLTELVLSASTRWINRNGSRPRICAVAQFGTRLALLAVTRPLDRGVRLGSAEREMRHEAITHELLGDFAHATPSLPG